MSDKELLERVILGDRKSFTALYNKFHPQVFKTAFGYLITISTQTRLFRMCLLRCIALQKDLLIKLVSIPGFTELQ